MMVSSTYNHRIIQGAESGQLLAYLHKLLVGNAGLFEEIFEALNIPHQPYRSHQRSSSFRSRGRINSDRARPACDATY